jgi:hypothetical protein
VGLHQLFAVDSAPASLSFRYPACVFWSLRLFRDFTNFNVMSLD